MMFTNLSLGMHIFRNWQKLCKLAEIIVPWNRINFVFCSCTSATRTKRKDAYIFSNSLLSVWKLQQIPLSGNILRVNFDESNLWLLVTRLSNSIIFMFTITKKNKEKPHKKPLYHKMYHLFTIYLPAFDKDQITKFKHDIWNSLRTSCSQMSLWGL